MKQLRTILLVSLCLFAALLWQVGCVWSTAYVTSHEATKFSGARSWRDKPAEGWPAQAPSYWPAQPDDVWRHHSTKMTSTYAVAKREVDFGSLTRLVIPIGVVSDGPYYRTMRMKTQTFGRPMRILSRGWRSEVITDSGRNVPWKLAEWWTYHRDDWRRGWMFEDPVGGSPPVYSRWVWLPTDLIVPGLIVNTILYGALLFVMVKWGFRLIFWLLRLPQRWRRKMDGQCTECGYDLGGLKGDRCPECGAEWKASSH